MLDDYIIKDYYREIYSIEDFYQTLKQFDNNDFGLFIGSDSKVMGKDIVIVTAMCLHKPGTSGKIFYIRDVVSRKDYPNLRTRMLLEAFRSLEIAMELDSKFSNNIEIHLDVGDTIKSKTSAYEAELQALVVGQGYSCQIKPDSWAGCSVADKIVNSRNKMRE